MLPTKTPQRLLSTAFLFVASSLVAACSGNFQAVTPPQDPEAGALVNAMTGPAAFEGCESRALRVDLNVEDRSQKADLLSVWKTLAKYPSLKIKAIDSAEGQASLRLHLARSCGAETCAKEMGWYDAQIALLALPGAKVTCDTSVEAMADHNRAIPDHLRRDATEDVSKQDQQQDQQQSHKKNQEDEGDHKQDESKQDEGKAGGVGVGS